LVRLLVLLLAAQTGWAGDCRIVLAPGAFAAKSVAAKWFLSPEDYFADYRRAFEAAGCEVRTIEFPPDATIEVRGMVLRDQVERWVKESGSVSIVAHSQAGMDARYALKSLELRGVRVLVTIGTPHEGTPLADWVVENRERRSLLYWIMRLVGYDLRALSFAGEFRPEFLTEKKKYFEQIEGVRYASAVANCRRRCHLGLRLVEWWTGVGDGDGLVPDWSQRFGEDLGEFDLDHISSVDRDPEKATERRRLLDRILAEITGSGPIADMNEDLRRPFTIEDDDGDTEKFPTETGTCTGYLGIDLPE
jgi:hypothetical protein